MAENSYKNSEEKITFQDVGDFRIVERQLIDTESDFRCPEEVEVTGKNNDAFSCDVGSLFANAAIKVISDSTGAHFQKCPCCGEEINTINFITDCPGPVFDTETHDDFDDDDTTRRIIMDRSFAMGDLMDFVECPMCHFVAERGKNDIIYPMYKTQISDDERKMAQSDEYQALFNDVITDKVGIHLRHADAYNMMMSVSLKPSNILLVSSRLHRTKAYLYEISGDSEKAKQEIIEAYKWYRKFLIEPCDDNVFSFVFYDYNVDTILLAIDLARCASDFEIANRLINYLDTLFDQKNHMFSKINGEPINEEEDNKRYAVLKESYKDFLTILEKQRSMVGAKDSSIILSFTL